MQESRDITAQLKPMNTRFLIDHSGRKLSLETGYQLYINMSNNNRTYLHVKYGCQPTISISFVLYTHIPIKTCKNNSRVKILQYGSRKLQPSLVLVSSMAKSRTIRKNQSERWNLLQDYLAI